MDTVLSNELILENILAQLPAWDLMTCNCVNRHWNQTSRKILSKKNYSNVSIRLIEVQGRHTYIVGCRHGSDEENTHKVYFPFYIKRQLPNISRSQWEEYERYNLQMKIKCYVMLFSLLHNCRSVKSVLIETMAIELENEEDIIKNAIETITGVRAMRFPIWSLICDFGQMYFLRFFKPECLNFWSRIQLKSMYEMARTLHSQFYKVPFISLLGRDCDSVNYLLRGSRFLSIDTSSPAIHHFGFTFELRKWQHDGWPIEQYFSCVRFFRERDRPSLEWYLDHVRRELPRTEVVADPLRAPVDQSWVLRVWTQNRSDWVYLRVDISDHPQYERAEPREGVVEKKNGHFMVFEVAKKLNGRFLWPENIC